MNEHDNLTTRDLAEPRHAGDETAEDMPLTREDQPDAEAREPAQLDREAAVSDGTATTEPLLGFSETRSRLEAQWDSEGDDASTEDLRVALTGTGRSSIAFSQREQAQPPPGPRVPVGGGSGRVSVSGRGR
jgi:hypothetical protein